jgi:hypothetical protein
MGEQRQTGPGGKRKTRGVRENVNPKETNPKKIEAKKIEAKKIEPKKMDPAKIRREKVRREKVRPERIIEDPKLRGEWAESVFVERASARGLAVSKPWGESKSFDFVVGSPGRFVSVQVKSTTVKMGGGYMCTVKKNNQHYAPGAFDFLAAYVIAEDVWYIVPAEKFAGRVTLILSSDSGEAKYEEFREAWELLRKVAGANDLEKLREREEPEPFTECAEDEQPAKGGQPMGLPGNAIERLRASMNFVRRQMERGEVAPRKVDEE